MTPKNNYAINTLLFDRNEVIQTFDTLPLLVSITFKAHGDEYFEEEKGEDSFDNLMQFHQFIDQLSSKRMEFPS